MNIISGEMFINVGFAVYVADFRIKSYEYLVSVIFHPSIYVRNMYYIYLCNMTVTNEVLIADIQQKFVYW